MGADAPIPASKRKTRRALHVGASAAAIVDKVNNEKVLMVIQRRPYSSLSGANTMGPKTYPTRYIDMGRILTFLSVMLNVSAMKEISLLGSDEPRVLLMVTRMPIVVMTSFLVCRKVNILVSKILSSQIHEPKTNCMDSRDRRVPT